MRKTITTTLIVFVVSLNTYPVAAMNCEPPGDGNVQAVLEAAESTSADSQSQVDKSVVVLTEEEYLKQTQHVVDERRELAPGIKFSVLPGNYIKFEDGEHKVYLNVGNLYRPDLIQGLMSRDGEQAILIVPTYDPSDSSTVSLSVIRIEDGQVLSARKVHDHKASFGSFNIPMFSTTGLESLHVDTMGESSLMIFVVDSTHFHAAPKTRVLLVDENDKVRVDSEIPNISAENVHVLRKDDGRVDRILLWGPSVYNYSDVDRREEWQLIVLGPSFLPIRTAKPYGGRLIIGRNVSLFSKQFHVDEEARKVYVTTYENGWINGTKVFEINVDSGEWSRVTREDGKYATEFQIQSDGTIAFK